MAPKRGLFLEAGDCAKGKRWRVEATPGSSSDAEPPSSPSSSPIDSVQRSCRRLWDEICRFITPMYRKLESLESKLERIDERIEDLTVKVDNMKRPFPSRHNHEQSTQEAIQKGTSAEAQGLATALLGKVQPENTSIRLCFLNRVKTHVYHDDEIKSESGTAIKIGIFNGDKPIESGWLSNVQVEIFALEGDFPHASPKSWTAKKFNKHRASARDGNRNVLVGEGTKAQLKNGQCDLGSIRFTEGSSKARGGKFIIGARVCGGEVPGLQVQEAVMSPVVVQDRRNKSNEKSHPPKLKDGVHRLEGISKDGELYKRLEKEKIITVEDFLKAYNKDPYNLANILKLKMEHKPWKKITKHAKECSLEGRNKLKSFICTEKNVKLFFNCVHCIVGAEFFGGQYTLSSNFTPEQKELTDRLKQGAYAGLDALPEDHVMTDNSPNPIHMDNYTGIAAGPSYMSSEQPSCYARPTAAQVEGTLAAEELSRVWVQPSCANVNNGPVPCSSIPDHHIMRNYQVGGFPVPPFLGLRDAETEVLCANANNNDPGLSSSTANRLHTYNYQVQGIQFGGQDQFSALLNALPLGGASDSCQFVPNQDARLAFLYHQADNNSYVTPGLDDVEMQRELFWSVNGALGASTSAYMNMAALPPEQLVIAGGVDIRPVRRRVLARRQ
ncbi:hypothetical protein BS78_08G100500 [Paspalum vaginatum]|nr:hypothetical protein BS78_08G100500 [Paspalum vaginatum]